MAGFCGSCGFPLGANAQFCAQCGARGAAGDATPPPALRPSATGSGLKIAMVVLACVGVAGVAAIGTLWYAAHRVKEAVVAKAQENGVDLHSIVPPSKTSNNKHRTHLACDLASKDEVAGIVGQPVVRTEYQEKACLYFGPPGLTARLAREQAAGAMKHAQAPGAKVSAVDMANVMDQLVNNLGVASGEPANGGEQPLIMLMVDEDGRGAMTAMNATNAMVKGIAHAADPDGKEPGLGGKIDGLGDQAVQLPKLGLRVLQGDTLIGVIAGPVPDANAKSISIAKLVLKRL